MVSYLRTLNFEVNRQRITKSGDFNDIVAGSKGYLHASFVFSDDWDGCAKVAAFYDIDGNEYAVLIKNDECDIPDEVTDGRKFKLRLIGVKSDDYKIQTNDVTVFQKEVY